MKYLLTMSLILFFLSCTEEKVSSVSISTSESSSAKIDKTIVSVDFKTLSNFELPIADPTMADQEDLKFISEDLPKEVSKLNNRKVQLKGFMIPIKFNKEEKIVSFSFTADQDACCQGKIPALNEIIYCTSETAYPDLRDTLLEVTGTFKIDPQLNESNGSMTLYTMSIDSIKELKLMPPVKGPDISF